MRRRDFITLVGGSAAAWPFAARAQPERVRRICVLLATDETNLEQGAPLKEAFVRSLQKFGWTAGTNVMIDYRWGGGDRDRVRLYAAELAGMQPDVIWTVGGLALLALKRATHIIPIVVSSVYDPIGSGYVASLTRPDGNITGFTAGEFSIGGKILGVLKEAAPQVSRVAVLLDLEQPPHVALWRAIEATAESVGVRLTPADIQGPADIERAIEALAREPNGALIVQASPVTGANRELIAALAVRHRLPTAFGFRYFVRSGGLVSYGVNQVEQSRQAAGYVDRILRGERPADLPIQQPTKFELVINLKTANALGLEIPSGLLARADEVIE